MPDTRTIIERQRRICNICSFHRNAIVEAKYVASGYDEDVDITRLVHAGLWNAMQWYECEGHGPNDNKGFVRVSLVPIDEWFKSVGLGV